MNDLKRLISKLKAEGDVTSQEAFEVWKKFFLYNLKGRISDIRDLTVWYRIAHMLLAKGKRGHFIESIPTERCNVRDRKMSSAIEGCRRYIEAPLKAEEIEIGKDAPFENVSFSDLTFYEGRMILFRCGIAPLLEGKTKYPKKEPCFRTFDGVRLLELAEKDDITKEESDWIFDYADLANTIRFYKFNCKPLQAWFDSVFKKLVAGKRGNFLYTLPTAMYGRLYDGSKLYRILSHEDLIHTIYIFKNGRVREINSTRVGILAESMKDVRYLGQVAPYTKPGMFSNVSPAFEDDTVKLEAVKRLKLPAVLAKARRQEDGRPNFAFLYSNDDTVKKIVDMDIKDICLRSETVEDAVNAVMERLMRQEIHDIAENDEWMEIER